MNHVGMKTLIPVYKPDGSPIPTTQNGILRLINGIDSAVPDAERGMDVVGMVASRLENSSSIDGAIAEYETQTVYNLVGTRSF